MDDAVQSDQAIVRPDSALTRRRFLAWSGKGIAIGTVSLPLLLEACAPAPPAAKPADSAGPVATTAPAATAPPSAQGAPAAAPAKPTAAPAAAQATVAPVTAASSGPGGL